MLPLLCMLGKARGGPQPSFYWWNKNMKQLQMFSYRQSLKEPFQGYTSKEENIIQCKWFGHFTCSLEHLQSTH